MAFAPLSIEVVSFLLRGILTTFILFLLLFIFISNVSGNTTFVHV